MNKDEMQKKLLETFKIEADEHLRSITDGLLQLEKELSDEERIKLIEEVHREAHSLKGASRAVNLLDIELICHAIENIFSAWKRKELNTTQQQFDILHQTLGMLQQVLTNLTDDTLYLDKKDISETVLKINQLVHPNEPILLTRDTQDIHAKANTKEGHETASLHEEKAFVQSVRIPVSKLDTLLLKAEEMLIVKLLTRKYDNEFLNIGTIIRSWNNEWETALRQKSSQPLDTLLAHGLSNIKTLQNTITELHSQFKVDNRQISVLVDDMLDDAKKMLMLPFSTLMDSFPAMIRNISREQGKNVNFVLEGTEIEIDKRILEELKDPLIHILRNSIDHGIEKSEDRINKDLQGTIKVSISQSNENTVEIIISDDGHGIDLNALKTAAIKKGILTQNDAERIEDEVALSLIYRSGISTSPIITHVSGRGLGMAIVQERMEKIGGHIKVQTQAGKGTEITLTLPLILTTFKGLLIKVVDQLLMLSTVHLERIVRIRPQEIKTIENKTAILLDSVTIPLIRLDEILALSYSQAKIDPQKYVPIMIIQFGDTRVAFQVDEVYNVQEVLVKKLSHPLVKVKYISAATILETGIPVPILSASDLIKVAIKDFLPQKPVSASEEVESMLENTILIVEDSITTRMLLKNILEMAGYDVLTAVDGSDAWRVLKESPVSLVVSDIEMPRMDGFELAKKIRDDKQLGELPIVLVTSRESREDREHGIDVGANAYIVKSSFDDSNLLSIIERLL